MKQRRGCFFFYRIKIIPTTISSWANAYVIATKKLRYFKCGLLNLDTNIITSEIANKITPNKMNKDHKLDWITKLIANGVNKNNTAKYSDTIIISLPDNLYLYFANRVVKTKKTTNSTAVNTYPNG